MSLNCILIHTLLITEKEIFDLIGKEVNAEVWNVEELCDGINERQNFENRLGFTAIEWE